MSTTDKNTLRMGEALTQNQFLLSPNGSYKLIHQDDGNVVIYDKGGVGTAIWAAQTWHMQTQRCTVKEDGTFAMIDTSGKEIWVSTQHGGKYGPQYRDSSLRLLDDGNLVVYAKDGSVVWSAKPGAPNLPAANPPGALGALHAILSAPTAPAELKPLLAPLSNLDVKL